MATKEYLLLSSPIVLSPWLGDLSSYKDDFISQNPQAKRQHTVGLGNIVIDYTSPMWKLNPIAIGMDISGYEYPNVFANDQLEQQKLKSLGIKYMRMDLKYSTPGDPTSKIVCSANGCDTRWTGDQWVQAIKAIGA